MKKMPYSPYSSPQRFTHMTAFEKALVEREAQDRKDARAIYVEGIQGRDGGCFPGQDHEATDY